MRSAGDLPGKPGRLSVQDDAKLIFGVVFSLRNMVRKLSGPLVNYLQYSVVVWWTRC